ncbi:sporulation inhibitor of replication protein SirA [Bacillus tianshenii]|nr:sporulation inhibitor of replication protein SirA [Bacillus tianshenii]
MRHYSMYLLRDDVAEEYFGKESLLYRLFLEYEQTTMEQSNIIERQVQYITLPIPTAAIQFQLQKELKRYSGYTSDGQVHSLHIKSRTGISEAQLSVFPSFMTLSARGGYEAETIYFEILRKMYTSFLAMDFETNRYGWLNPIKQRNFV